MKRTLTYSSSYNEANWKAISEENFAILAGSGVSIWTPTGLPSGQNISNYLIRRILNNTNLSEDKKTKIRRYIEQLPFEVIMNKCNQQDLLRDWLYNCFSDSVHNNIHASIVQLALTSSFPAIITTNYDTCFEHYLVSENIPFQVVRNEQEAIRIDSQKGLILFKIHGSAEMDHKDSMLFSESHESKMPQWKLNILRSILNNRNLLIIGYSGLDFEICPELHVIGLKKLIWNFYNNTELDRSPGRKRIVANETKSQLDELIDIVGDMCELLDGISPLPTYTPLLDSSNVLEPLSELSETNEVLWTARTILALGIGQLTLDVIRKINLNQTKDISTKISVMKIQARAYFFNNELEKALSTHVARREMIKSYQGCKNFTYLDALIAVSNIYQDKLK